MRRYDYMYLVLSGFFLSSLVLANAMVFKFFDVTLPFVGIATMSIGVLPYPLTFLCTDLISELYGKKRADAIVLTGFAVSVYMMLLLQLGRVIPVSHLQDESIQSSYIAVFGQSSRAIFGSMVAYLLAQFIDVRLYHFWRHLTKGKHMWLRNNASTLFSQLLDTTVVVMILFFGIWTSGEIMAVILSSYLYKLLIAVLDTPLMYLGSWWLRDIKEESIRKGLITEHG